MAPHRHHMTPGERTAVLKRFEGGPDRPGATADELLKAVADWFDEVDELTGAGRWSDAFGQVLALTAYEDAALAASASSIMQGVAAFATRLHHTLNEISGNLDMTSFSISVSVPVGISVTFAFGEAAASWVTDARPSGR
jgi:hypothetical protein